VRLNAFPVGLPETSTEQTITIRPNPFNNYVTIETPGTSGSVIEVFSIQGQYVETLRMEGEKGTFNLGHLPAGLYFLNPAGHLKKCVLPIIKAD
jgi:hypothetical protein